MAFWFKNKRKKEQPPSISNREKIAIGILQKCVTIQTKWASYLQRKAERLSLRTKKYLLLLFCLVSVGYSLYIIGKSFRRDTKSLMIITAINVPSHATKTGSEASSSTTGITEEEYKSIERFRFYMDSLGQSISGRTLRDCILFTRPGLMDSVSALEKLYQLQTLKK